MIIEYNKVVGLFLLDVGFIFGWFVSDNYGANVVNYLRKIIVVPSLVITRLSAVFANAPTAVVSI